MKACFAFLFLVISFYSYGQLDLLADINQIPDAVQSGIDGNNLCIVNSTLFFAGRSEKGYELWKSDGTTAGTIQVKDISKGIGSSNPGNLVNVNGTIFFIADDGAHGKELWKSDGSEAGTVMVKDINPGSNSSVFTNLTSGSSVLFFAVENGSGKLDLWKSDGTAPGTIIIKTDVISSSLTQQFAVINGTLFFRAEDESSGIELWKSDGTFSGTSLVKDIRSGTGSSDPVRFTVNDQHLFFIANDGNLGEALWKSDGTEAGTSLVKDIRSDIYSGITFLASANDTLFFKGNGDDNSGLWKSDGTEAGTVFIEDVFSSYTNIGNIKAAGDLLYWTQANIIANKYELWRSDGSVSGTRLAKVLQSVFHSPPRSFVEFNGLLYFIASDQNGDLQLWKSDGTESGTTTITSMSHNLAIPGSRPLDALTPADTRLYFIADDGNTGNELWSSDGASSEPQQITNVPNASYASFTNYFTVLGENVYFSADDENHGSELWRSDGTASGTVLVKDLWTGSSTNSSNPSRLMNAFGSIYFNAYVPGAVSGVWKTNGTAAGTVSVDYMAGSSMLNAVNVNGLLFYLDSGNKIARTDGTANGTRTIVNGIGTAYSNPYSMTPFGDRLYFVAYDGTTGLWKTDGTDAGTEKIKTLTYIRDLNYTDNLLYFAANDGIHGMELWRSDGTEEGTEMVTDIQPGAANAFNPDDNLIFGNVGATAYFVADDGIHGAELWKTNGTPEGTAIVKDIRPGAESSSITNLTHANGVLYFVADDGIHGKELWKTDGTEDGTELVMDINEGVYHSSPENFLVLNGILYFTADNGIVRTLWKYNGQPCSIMMVTNNTIANVGGKNRQIVALGNTILVEGAAPGTGEELFVHNIQNDIELPLGCKLNQTIMFDALPVKEFGDDPFSLISSSSSGLPVSYVSSDPSVASIAGNMVTILKAGEVYITAGNAGDTNFNQAEEVSRLLTINKASQTITFASLPAKTFGNAPFALTASSTSGLPVSYVSSDPSIVSITGNMATILKAGEVTITAQQNGDDYYLSATDVDQQLVINKADQTITFPDISSKTIADSPFTLTATASSGLPVSYSASSTKISVADNIVTINQAGSVRITAIQTGNDNFMEAPAVERYFCISPPTPVVSRERSATGMIVLNSSSNEGNQWFKNAILVPGATDSQLIVSESGSYSVQISVDGCPSEYSESQLVNDEDIVITNVEALRGALLRLQPNPADDRITLDIPEAEGKTMVVIYDSHGLQVMNSSVNQFSPYELDISKLSTGMYTIYVLTGKNAFSDRFIKK